MQEFAAPHFHHHENVQNAKSRRYSDDEIAGHDCLCMILDKRRPPLAIGTGATNICTISVRRFLGWSIALDVSPTSM